MEERMRKPCSINGCEKPSAGRGWCSTHWLRWRKHGNPNYLAPLPPQCRPQHIGCRADECGRPHHAQGWCSMHAARVKKSGDPNVVGPRHPGRKRLERPSYDGAHKRVSRERGRAIGHICADCGSRADEWSYDGSSSEELATTTRKGETLAYSANPADYSPRCRPCHRRLDRSLIRARDHMGRWSA